VRRSGVDYRMAHFDRARVLFAPGQSGLAETTYDAYLGGVARALKWMALPDEFPFANLYLAPSRVEFDLLVAHITRTPTDPWRVGQPLGLDLCLLSPDAYPADAAPAWLGSDGLCDSGMYARLVAHETVHMVEEFHSPREAMENRPMWWSEGLAVLISEQHRIDHDVRDHLRADLDAGTLPEIEELHGGPAYTWAWAVVDCLRRTVGRKKVTELITGTDGGDILGLLGVDRERFDPQWRDHAMTEARAILD
jgi:hypothetical protein